MCSVIVDCAFVLLLFDVVVDYGWICRCVWILCRIGLCLVMLAVVLCYVEL